MIAFKYDHAIAFTERLVAVEKDGKWGCIDKKGKEVIACKYDDEYYLRRFDGTSKGNFFLMKKDGKWCWIDKKGKVIKKFEIKDEY